MNPKKSSVSISEKRLLSVKEGADYVGIGTVSFRAWASKIGCVRHIGSRVLFDKEIINNALDKITE